MERHETNVVRDESAGVVREESHVTTTGAGAPVSDDTEVVSRVSPTRRALEVIYLVFGIINGLLLIRLVLKLLGANPQAPFTDFMYGVTSFLLAPFRGLFPALINGKSVFEPSVVIAIIVYALVAVALAKIVEITFSRGIMASHRSSTRDFRPRSD
jgi:uncharacterized protein YggT (Ycf19 family)